jgi:hypothetical protein
MSNDFVIINVGGTKFETTYATLSGSIYFRKLFDNQWNKSPDVMLKIDRSAVLFEHVLSLLRNPEYPYPREHVGELDFYMINHTIPSLATQQEGCAKTNNRCEIMWQYMKNNMDICKIGECGNKTYPEFKYCFDCVKPELVPLNIVHHYDMINIKLIYYNDKYQIPVRSNFNGALCAFCDMDEWMRPIHELKNVHVVTQKDGPQICIQPL